MAGEALDRPEVDALYDLDPSEFVAARDTLAKELKSDGDADTAREVKALKKPTKVAWALNQVARSHGREVAALIESGAALRQRQAEALGDRGAPDREVAAALRDAAAVRRDLVRALVAKVVALAGEGARDEAAATLEAASLDEATGAELTAGRLTTAAPRPADMGFGGMPEPSGSAAPARRSTGARSTPGGRAGTAADEPARRGATPPPVRLDRRRIDKLERALAKAERDLAAAEDDLADASRRLRRADDAVADAQERAARARDARADAEQARDAAAASADAARSALDAASPP